MSLPGHAVRAQLQKILRSGQFKSSGLQQQFLSFVVEKTLDGSAGEIKEYAIGAEAFGRGEDFDPRLDSVVRVVARRVRDRLAEYYRTDGRDDPVVIALEKGSYVPSFEPKREIETRAVAAQNEEANGAAVVAAGEKQTAPAEASRRRIGVRWWIAAGVTVLTALIAAAYFLSRPSSPPRISKYAQLTDDGQGKLGAFAVGTPAPLVTDGARVYFTEVSGAQVVLRQVPVAGGQTLPLGRERTDPLVVMDISPDRSELLATGFSGQSPMHRCRSCRCPTVSRIRWVA